MVPFGKLRTSCAHDDYSFVTLSLPKGEPVEGCLASSRPVSSMGQAFKQPDEKRVFQNTFRYGTIHEQTI
jgi:hypothetical protein